MTPSRELDLTASPEMLKLLDYVRERMSKGADEAASTQPEFERGLRDRMLALERRIHTADFGRLDAEARGILLDELRYRGRPR